MRQPKTDPAKHCPFCGQQMLRRRFPSGRLEDRAQFLKRVYCNRLCMARAMVQEEVKLAGLRRRAVKFRGDICENCGGADDLHIHHMDKNPANNAKANLRTWCGSCHQKWHWAHGRQLPKRSPQTCSVCGKPARKLGLCQKHYQRFRKYGNPRLTKKNIGGTFVIVGE